MIEAIIFDIDGVVVDSDKLQVEAEKETARILAEELGVELDFDNIDWVQFQGWGRTKIAKTLFGTETPDNVCEDYRERVVGTSVEIMTPDNLTPIKDINNFMDFLVVRGILLGAATSSNRRIYSGYTEIIDMSRIRTSVAHRECVDDKPNPGPFREVMRRLNVESEDTLVIEDSANGITAGRRAGALVLGLATTKPPEFLQSSTGAHLVAEDFRHAAHLLQPHLP
jgi:beta-phosphoglucomutase